MSKQSASDLIGLARIAAPTLANAETEQKNSFLSIFAQKIEEFTSDILDANRQDLEQAERARIAEHLIDRLRLDDSRLADLAAAVRQVAALPDPIGQIIDSHPADAGFELARMRVPLGVIGFIYESRPSVTADAAALCIKSGNPVVLRGGREAWQSNTALAAAAAEALAQAGLPGGCICHLQDASREETGRLIKDERLALIIPRGGPQLVRRVRSEASAAVLSHEHGNCHLYVDASADIEMAIGLACNGKMARPAVCNALEKLLVNQQLAASFLPTMAEQFAKGKVEMIGCEQTCRIIGSGCRPATEQDWHEEYLDLKIAIKVVANVDEAIEHINRYGSSHTDAICANDEKVCSTFLRQVDSASVMANVSTRFADGVEYGLGAEVGISTGRLEPRGPVGLAGLTSLKWIARGCGQIRN